MASLLLSDPILASLSPFSLCKLQGLSKQFQKVIAEHLHHKKQLQIQKMSYHISKIAPKMPNVQHLTIQIGYNNATQIFQFPLRKLTILMDTDIHFKYGNYYWSKNAAMYFMKTLFEEMEAHPLLSLEEVEILFPPKTYLYEEEVVGIMDWDDDGPVEDIDFRYKNTDKYDGINYMAAAENQEDIELFHRKLMEFLTSIPNLSKLIMPAQFINEDNTHDLFPFVKQLPARWVAFEEMHSHVLELFGHQEEQQPQPPPEE